MRTRLKFSSKAKAVTDRLARSKDSEKAGSIAAVDPQTGEICYGKTVAEAAKEGNSKTTYSSRGVVYVRNNKVNKDNVFVAITQ